MPNRRNFIKTVCGTAVAIGLAGCSDDGSGGESGDSGDGTPTDTRTATEARTTESDIDQTFDPVNMSGDSPEQIAEGVNLLSHTVYETSNGVGVTGVVENVGDVTFTEVVATVTLVDESGRVAEFEDTSAAELDELSPGLQWRFWIPFEGEELTSEMRYEIDVAVERADPTATPGTETNTTES